MSENGRINIIASMVVDCCLWDDRTKAVLRSRLHAQLSQWQIESKSFEFAYVIGGFGKGTTAPCSIVRADQDN
eukprot:scaffold3610_cov99-Cylindrotheca_fusiformis.AAC.2